MLKDIKEALSSSRKADTTHVRRAFQIYTARPCEYGSDKYERANFIRPTGETAHDEPTGADFERLRAYLRAARDHIDETLESMERHQAQDPMLLDVPGMKKAAYAVDTDTKPGQKIGASLLPHVAPACSSLMMAITQAVDCGLLPRDPGTPWRDALTTAVQETQEGKKPAEVFEGLLKVHYKSDLGAISDSAMKTEEKPFNVMAWVDHCDRCGIQMFFDRKPERSEPGLGRALLCVECTHQTKQCKDADCSHYLVTFPGDPIDEVKQLDDEIAADFSKAEELGAKSNVPTGGGSSGADW